MKRRVVWASTSNPYYELDGVRPGESLADASRQLKNIEPPFHIGLNYWYLARGARYTAVLKVRGGVVRGAGDRRECPDQNPLGTKGADALVLLRSAD